LENNGLIHHVIGFVKDENNNLGTIAPTLWPIINCELFKILQVYKGTWSRHVMFKPCQYAMNDDKFFGGLTFVNVKMFKLFCQKKNLGKKIIERELRVGKCMH
jgi:hypothetical protein